MTRDQIAEGLDLLVLQLANGVSHVPPGWLPHEWAYVCGVASFGVLQIQKQLRDRSTGNCPPPGGVSETP